MGQHDHRIHRGPQQSHDEAIRFIEPADIAAARLSGNLETDHSVDCADEVADYIGPTVKRREAQITVVKNCQFLG